MDETTIMLGIAIVMLGAFLLGSYLRIRKSGPPPPPQRVVIHHHGPMAEAAIVVGLCAWLFFGLASIRSNYGQIRLSVPERAALKFPGNYRAQLKTSSGYLQAGDYARALSYAQRAAAIHPDRASALLNVSTAAARLGAWGIAHQALERAFAIYPCQQVAKNLAYAARVVGHDKQAEMLMDLIPELPDDLDLEEPTI